MVRYFRFSTGRPARRGPVGIAAGMLLLAMGALIGSSQTPSPAAAVRAPVEAPASAGNGQGVAQIQDLLDSLARFDQNGRMKEQKLGFEIPERALNEYLAYSLGKRPRPGIGAATVTLISRNEISTVAEVDFDAVHAWDPKLIPDLLRPSLSGRRSLRVTAQFQSQDGFVTLTVKSAQGPEGNLIPNPIMADLLRAIGGRQPEAFDPGKPIPLPFGLKRIWIEKRAICGET